MHSKSYYLNLRDEYRPAELRTIFLFESPPISGKYFYDVTGSIKEPLFSAIMRLFNWSVETKAQGLARLRDAGYFLLDATYEPVNAMPRAQRKRVIAEHYPDLSAELRRNSEAEVIIGAVTVLDAVGNRLVKDGFRLLNHGRRIPFPANGRQGEFHRLAREVVLHDCT